MTQPVETSQNVSAEDRRRLLAEMLQKRASRAVERPLSLGQERLWLMASLDPGGSPYSTSRSPIVSLVRSTGPRSSGKSRDCANATRCCAQPFPPARDNRCNASGMSRRCFH